MPGQPLDMHAVTITFEEGTPVVHTLKSLFDRMWMEGGIPKRLGKLPLEIRPRTGNVLLASPGHSPVRVGFMGLEMELGARALICPLPYAHVQAMKHQPTEDTLIARAETETVRPAVLLQHEGVVVTAENFERQPVDVQRAVVKLFPLSAPAGLTMTERPVTRMVNLVGDMRLAMNPEAQWTMYQLGDRRPSAR